MGSKPRISLEDLGNVLAMSEEGYSQREIAVRAGCSQRTVCDVLKEKKRIIGSVQDLKIPGRKRKKTPEIKAKMQLEHGVSVSTPTTRRRLREAGHIGRKLRKKPRLTARHK